LILDFIIINVIKKMLFTKRYSVALSASVKLCPESFVCNGLLVDQEYVA